MLIVPQDLQDLSMGVFTPSSLDRNFSIHRRNAEHTPIVR